MELLFTNAHFLWYILAVVPLFLLGVSKKNKIKKIDFPNSFLLKKLRSNHENQSKKNWLRFLLRAVLLVSIVLFFSQPKILQWKSKEKPRHIHLLDHTASMHNPKTLDLTKAHLKNSIQSDSDEFYLFDQEIVKIENFEWLLANLDKASGIFNPERLIHFLERIHKSAVDSFIDTHVYIYSDYLGKRWHDFFSCKSPHFSKIHFHFLSSQSPYLENLKIQDFNYQRSILDPNKVKIFATIKNETPLPQQFLVYCHIQGQEHQNQEILLNAYEIETIEFTIPPHELDFLIGHLFLDFPDDFPGDNKHHFSIPSVPNIRIVKTPPTLKINDLYLDQLLNKIPWVQLDYFEDLKNLKIQSNIQLCILPQGMIENEIQMHSIQSFYNQGNHLIFNQNLSKNLNSKELKILENGSFNEMKTLSANFRANRFTETKKDHPIFMNIPDWFTPDYYKSRFLKWRSWKQIDATPLLFFRNKEPALSLQTNKQDGSILIPSFEWNESSTDWILSKSFKNLIHAYLLWIENLESKSYNQEIQTAHSKEIGFSSPGIYNQINPIAVNFAKEESDLSANAYERFQWTQANKIEIEEELHVSRHFPNSDFYQAGSFNLSKPFLILVSLLLIVEFLLKTKEIKDK